VEPQLESPLREAIAFLEAHGYRYAIIGGIAVTAWGTIRATRDIDLKVLVPDLDYATVRDAIRAAFPNPGRPHLPRNPLVVAVNIEGVVVDFLLTLPGYEEQIVTRALQRTIGDLRVWICAPEDLVVQKAVAGRPKDWEDIEGVLTEQHGRLDLDYLEDWLSQFAELLEQPEILSQYRAIQGRIAAVCGDAE
jgi:predicted nucleotidyltransferase